MVLLLALLWRLMGITDTQVWRDEATTIIHTYASWRDLVLRLARIEDTPPLGFLVVKAWAGLSREEWFLRLLPVILGTAWVDAIMRTARLIHSRAWWTAGLLAAFSPIPIHYSQEIRSYALLALLTAWCFWAAERFLAARSSQAWLWIVAGTGALAAHSHMAGVFVLPAVVVYLLARAGRSWRDVGNLASIGPLTLWTALILPLLWFARYWSAWHAAALDSWWVPQLSLARAGHLVQCFLGYSTLFPWSLRSDVPQAVWIGFLGERVVLLGACLLLVAGLADSRTRGTVLSLIMSAAAFLGALLVSGWLTLPNVLERTVLPAWTPVVLALGVGAMGCRIKWAGGPISATVVLAVSAVWAGSWAQNVYTPSSRTATHPLCFLGKPAEVQSLFEWMKPQVTPRDLILTAPRWYKEMTVYNLMDTISADQLLDEFDAYAGKPPRHKLRLADPREWEPRFEQQLRTRHERYGSDFNVWLVWWASIREPSAGSPEYWLLQRCRVLERREIYLDRPVAIVRLQPMDAPARTAESWPHDSASDAATRPGLP